MVPTQKSEHYASREIDRDHPLRVIRYRIQTRSRSVRDQLPLRAGFDPDTASMHRTTNIQTRRGRPDLLVDTTTAERLMSSTRPQTPKELSPGLENVSADTEVSGAAQPAEEIILEGEQVHENNNTRQQPPLNSYRSFIAQVARHNRETARLIEIIRETQAGVEACERTLQLLRAASASVERNTNADDVRREEYPSLVTRAEIELNISRSYLDYCLDLLQIKTQVAADLTQGGREVLRIQRAEQELNELLGGQDAGGQRNGTPADVGLDVGDFEAENPDGGESELLSPSEDCGDNCQTIQCPGPNPARQCESTHGEERSGLGDTFDW